MIGATRRNLGFLPACVYRSERWGDERVKAWKDLKEILSEPTLLAAPRHEARKRIETDASEYGLGGVILKEEEGSACTTARHSFSDTVCGEKAEARGAEELCGLQLSRRECQRPPLSPFLLEDYSTTTRTCSRLSALAPAASARYNLKVHSVANDLRTQTRLQSTQATCCDDGMHRHGMRSKIIRKDSFLR